MSTRTIASTLLCLALASMAFAQATGTGSVIGRITDASGAVLPGANITLKSPEALGVYSAVSGPDGSYRVGNLPPATYEARAELQGFQTAVQRITVRLNTTLETNFTLTLGAMSETVTVPSRRRWSIRSAPASR
jgi:Carboxypeptidase regulatory-like domain